MTRLDEPHLLKGVECSKDGISCKLAKTSLPVEGLGEG